MLNHQSLLLTFALVVDLAPATPTPFNATHTQYVGPNMQTVGIVGAGTPEPATFTFTLPNTGAGLGLVYQAVTFDNTGPLRVSNGILARLHSL